MKSQRDDNIYCIDVNTDQVAGKDHNFGDVLVLKIQPDTVTIPETQSPLGLKIFNKSDVDRIIYVRTQKVVERDILMLFISHVQDNMLVKNPIFTAEKDGLYQNPIDSFSEQYSEVVGQIKLDDANESLNALNNQFDNDFNNLG